MSYLDMKAELSESIPGMSRVYAGTLINRAWRVVRDSNLWSFQLQQGGFATPAVTTAGSITATLGSNIIVGDAAASAAWAALPFMFSPSRQQIRALGYSIYNIISYTAAFPQSFTLKDVVTGFLYQFSSLAGALEFQPTTSAATLIPNPVFADVGNGATYLLSVSNGAMQITPAAALVGVLQLGVVDTLTGLSLAFQTYYGALQIAPSIYPPPGILTLDRPFIDPLPSYSTVGYQMFLAYIPAPKYFKRWLNVADMSNSWSLDFWTSRQTINMTDPTRLYTSNPSYLLGLGTDQRPGSSTLGQQLYELYPNPSTAIAYQTYYVIQSPDLIANSDELPYPITQEVVLSKARVYAYEWAEARKDIMAAKGSGANYSLLKKEGEAEFRARLKTLRLIDKDQVDSYNSMMGSGMAMCRMPYYNTQARTANMGVGGWR